MPARTSDSGWPPRAHKAEKPRSGLPPRSPLLTPEGSLRLGSSLTSKHKTFKLMNKMNKSPKWINIQTQASSDPRQPEKVFLYPRPSHATVRKFLYKILPLGIG